MEVEHVMLMQLKPGDRFLFPGDFHHPVNVYRVLRLSRKKLPIIVREENPGVECPSQRNFLHIKVQRIINNSPRKVRST